MIPMTQEEIAEALIFSGIYGISPLDGPGTQIISYDFSNTMVESGITFTNWTASYKALSREIMAEYERVLDVDFSEASHNSTNRHLELGLASDIPGNTVGTGGYSYGFSGGNIDYDGFQYTENLDAQSYREVFAHELGHALGLKHTFSGSPVIPDAYDHEGYSVMSYTGDPGPSVKTGYNGFWNILQEHDLAILDVVGLQHVWGERLDHNTSDTTYGTVTEMHRTLVDGGGNDTIDLGGWQTDKMEMYIDLGRGGLSEVGRDTGGVPEFLRFAIDYHSDIENVVAPNTERIDVKGNDLANVIAASEVFGAGGFETADHFEGLGGNDTMTGFTGDDTLLGGSGNDDMSGGDDDDLVLGGTGADLISGDDGHDLLGGDAMSEAELIAEFAAAGFDIA